MIENDKAKQDKLKQISDNDIGLRIKSARESLGFSQIDMHNKTGLSRTVLINYEAGRHKPSAREIKLICDALHLSPNFLIYGTETPHIIKEGLAYKILALGDAAILPVTFIIPLLGAILGHEEKRLILELIETVVKAKSPELLNGIMSILEAIPNPEDVDIEKTIDKYHPDPVASKKALSDLREKLINIPKK